MNKKGFTLIELLVIIVILGLISLLGVSSLMKLIVENNTKEFEYYGESMVAGAKLYIQKEGKDLIRAGTTFPIIIPLKTANTNDIDLVNDDYVQEFRSSKKSNKCDDENNGVRVNYDSSTKTYTYSYQLTCTSNSAKKLYRKTYDSDEFVVTEMP